MNLSKSCVGSLRGTAWDSRSFFYQLNPHWFLQPEVVGLIFLALEPWAWGPAVELGHFIPESSIFIHHIGWGTNSFHICTPPTSLDGCGFFNSNGILPFNLISDCSEWWLVYILVLILTWLCKEASHVFLCHCLDQKSLRFILNQISFHSQVLIFQFKDFWGLCLFGLRISLVKKWDTFHPIINIIYLSSI